jgi:peptidoglycan/LPS O-acetylase OafA/YrhL
MTVATVASTFGVGLILGAYSFRRRPWMTERTYAAMNAGGSACATIGSLLIGFVPFVVLEGTWCAVSVRDLVVARRPRPTGHPRPMQNTRSDS